MNLMIVVAVLLEHHHVAVAGDADGFEPHEIGLDARLIEPLRDAGIVGAVIGRRWRRYRAPGCSSIAPACAPAPPAASSAPRRAAPASLRDRRSDPPAARPADRTRTPGREPPRIRIPRAGLAVAVLTLPICGPPGSTVTIALTDCGRASVTSKPMPPPCEWVNRITGVPILSSSAIAGVDAPAAGWRRRTAPGVLMKASKIGSPILPAPGHCVWFIFSGKSPRSRALVQMRSSSRPVRMLRLPSIGVLPSGPGTRHVGRSAARRVVHHVDDVALLDEVIRPAGATVRRLQPVHASLSVAVEDHDRIGLSGSASAPSTSVYIAPRMISLPGSPQYLPPA